MILNKILTLFFGTTHEREIKGLQPLVQQINLLEPELVVLSDQDLQARALQLKARVTEANQTNSSGVSESSDFSIEAFAICREAADRRLGMMNILNPKFEFDFKQLSPEIASIALEAKAQLEGGTELREIMFPAKFYQEMRTLIPDSRWPFRMRCFDVQLMGGLVLNRGCIAEMKTGEGKTLVATLAVYLNALSGKGVHVITTNDYLAKVGAENNRPLYEFLGLSVGVIVSGLREQQRRDSYHSDVTYGTNNEFGFDYLRDNMARDIKDCVQRELNFAIIDEVDSILIDEARTPLIISGPAEASTGKYIDCDKVVREMSATTHYYSDEKTRHVGLTEEGVNFCEKHLGLDNLYGDVNTEWVHHISQALRAHVFFKKDVDYVVRDREVVIVDEFTGRMMEGRRYSEGLHQAIEAKERVPIARENQTLATITFQNYFRMYTKLGGMTGTADTEATEFGQIYKLKVTVIPTNKPMVRKDQDDLIYKTHREKLDAIVKDIRARNEKGQPILVGTVSIEKSEEISKRLSREGINHEVLNAKQHEREAQIIEFAGQLGKVTIATNMAGRGVDIKLGKGVIEAGGLYVLGTERHEARRIDNQLRGRAGRQGDVGESQFYLSLQDDLLRIFQSERISKFMDRFGAEEGEVITHPWINKAIANAQRRVEGQNFEMRKHLLEYDDVMNQQRTVIYKLRRRILKGEEIKDEINVRIEDSVDTVVSEFAQEGKHPETWDLAGLWPALKKTFNIDFSISSENLRKLEAEDFVTQIYEAVGARYAEIEKVIGEQQLRDLERQLLLMVIDNFWKDHLYSMDHLKEAIRFRGYAQKDPLQEYKKEGLVLFEGTMERITSAVIERLMHIDTDFITKQKEAMERARQLEEMQKQQMAMHQSAPPSNTSGTSTPTQVASNTSASYPPNFQGSVSSSAGAKAFPVATPDDKKVGRNDPCPCGSGKKYKKCCGANE